MFLKTSLLQWPIIVTTAKCKFLLFVCIWERLHACARAHRCTSYECVYKDQSLMLDIFINLYALYFLLGEARVYFHQQVIVRHWEEKELSSPLLKEKLWSNLLLLTGSQIHFELVFLQTRTTCLGNVGLSFWDRFSHWIWSLSSAMVADQRAARICLSLPTTALSFVITSEYICAWISHGCWVTELKHPCFQSSLFILKRHVCSAQISLRRYIYSVIIFWQIALSLLLHFHFDWNIWSTCLYIMNIY